MPESPAGVRVLNIDKPCGNGKIVSILSVIIRHNQVNRNLARNLVVLSSPLLVPRCLHSPSVRSPVLKCDMSRAHSS